MIRKSIFGTLIFGATTLGGCVSLPQPHDPRTELQVKTLAHAVCEQTAVQDVQFGRIVSAQGPRYQALLTSNQRLYLIDVLDIDDDKDPESLVIYAKEITTKTAANIPTASGNFANIVLQIPGTALFELRDAGLDGIAEKTRFYKKGLDSERATNIYSAQRVYSNAINDAFKVVNKY